MLVTVCTLYREQMCESFVRVVGEKLSKKEKEKMAEELNLDEGDMLSFSEVQVDGDDYQNASLNGHIG